MVDPTGDNVPAATTGLTTAEIAERYGRALNTVQKHWVTHADWPPVVGMRGNWKLYDAEAVDNVAKRLFLAAAPEPTGGPEDLLTQREVAEYLGIAPSTLRGYVSRGQFVAPDETEGGKRWRRRTVDANLPKRRPAVKREGR